MKKIKTEKYIALIAVLLIIVILELLVLAILKNDFILSHIINFGSEYKYQDEESYLVKTIGDWKQVGGRLIKTNDDSSITSVKIGDYVNYNEGIGYTHTPEVKKGVGTSKIGGDEIEGYKLETKELITEDLRWKILGINEKGELELISEKPTEQVIYLANDKGYINAVTTYNENGSIKKEGTLDKLCNDLYGNGENATRARSLNVDDINKLTKYDPTKNALYGVELKYRFSEESTKVQYSINGGATWGDTGYNTLKLPEETIGITSPGSIDVEYTEYHYNIANNLTTSDGYKSKERLKIINMIEKGIDESSINQWLASRCVICNCYDVNFCVRYIKEGFVESSNMFSSIEYYYCSGYRVRPVVTIKKDIDLIGNGANIGSVDNMWNLV